MPGSKNVKIGERYGNLVVINDLGTHWNGHLFRRKVELLCDCGKKCIKWFSVVKSGDIKSCGCLLAKAASLTHTTHALSKHPLFSVRNNMIRRCYKKESRDYHNYGGRGIGICKKWLYDFKAFHDWCIANGWEKGFHIDRINNDKNYCPSNCRIVTPTESARNKRNSNILRYMGKYKHINTWAELFGLPKTVLYARIFILNWPIDKALTQKKGTRNNKK